MQVIDFTAAHIEQAEHIALQNYYDERRYVPVLPFVGSVPDLMPLAQNGLGVAAFDGDTMLGFLCSVSPFQNAFRSTDATGVFSPMGANGAISKKRSAVYARMYQAASEKWVAAGASSHAICLYAHDTETQQQFFRYSFGLRCINAVRGTAPIDIVPCEEYEFTELDKDKYDKIFPLDLMLNKYQRTSPYFLSRKPNTLESFVRSYTENSERFFVAKYREDLCAYLMVASGGDTFITDDQFYMDMGGAFCMPEHRGKGVYQKLLNFTLSVLRKEGYTRFGVDFESYNPAAYGFWLKYFDAYTHSVVRRIDEYAIIKR